MNLLDRRIILVTGKGGTGKTTVAVALGLWAARTGKRTLICETKGATAVGALFHRPAAGYEPVPLHPNLWVMSITSEAALEDYVVQQIKVRQLYKLVFRNRVMGPFVDAVPGLHDAVHLGKVFDLVRQKDQHGRPTWDMVIVDAPATGHGLHMMQAPRAMMELTRAGPVYEGVRQVDEVVSNPDVTGIVTTCLPEEMPVNETIALWRRLGPSQRLVSACVLNEVAPLPIDERGDWDLARSVFVDHPDRAVAEAGHIADSWMQRHDRQEASRARLRDALPCPVVDLPFLYHRNLGFSELNQLSARLESSLGAI
jgi:anion-transporting  ArsA/GET3 family ATPase